MSSHRRRTSGQYPANDATDDRRVTGSLFRSRIFIDEKVSEDRKGALARATDTEHITIKLLLIVDWSLNRSCRASMAVFLHQGTIKCCDAVDLDLKVEAPSTSCACLDFLF